MLENPEGSLGVFLAKLSVSDGHLRRGVSRSDKQSAEYRRCDCFGEVGNEGVCEECGLIPSARALSSRMEWNGDDAVGESEP